MNASRYLIGILTSTLALLANAEADSTGRTWIAQKDGVSIVLNAETHIRTEVEYDEHFRRVVTPAFQSSEIALIEAYPENLKDRQERLAKKCEFSLPENSKLHRKVRTLTDLLASSGVTNFIPPDWAALSPELFVVIFIDDLQRPAIDRALRERGVIPKGIFLPIGFELSLGSKQKPKLIEPIDDYGFLQDHFCAFDSSMKEDVLASNVDGLIYKLMLLQPPIRKVESKEIAAAIVPDFLRFLTCAKKGVPCDMEVNKRSTNFAAAFLLALNDGSFNYNISTRNALWLAKIIRLSAGYKRMFISLGAAHVPDLKYGSKIYPGMLTLLRGAGFGVAPLD